MDLNRVMLIGRLAQDPELRSIPGGNSVASFSLATNRQWKDKSGDLQKQTEFHRLVAWGKLAEIVSQYLHKGRQVFVEGRLHTRDWTDDNKVKRYRTEVVLEDLIMLGSKPANGAPAKPEEGIVEDGGPQEVIEEEVKVEAIPF